MIEIDSKLQNNSVKTRQMLDFVNSWIWTWSFIDQQLTEESEVDTEVNTGIDIPIGIDVCCLIVKKLILSIIFCYVLLFLFVLGFTEDRAF